MISIIRPNAFLGGRDSDDRTNNFIPLGGNIIRIIKIRSVPTETEEEVKNMSDYDDDNIADDYDDENIQDPDFSEFQDELDQIPDDDETLDSLPDIDIDELDVEDFENRDEEEDFEGMEDDL